MVRAASAPGAVVDVKVVNPDGQETIVVNGFTYEAVFVPAPTITSITPNTGSVSGGYYMYIDGTNFNKKCKGVHWTETIVNQLLL